MTPKAFRWPPGWCGTILGLNTAEAGNFVLAAYHDLCPVPGTYDYWAYSTGLKPLIRREMKQSARRSAI